MQRNENPLLARFTSPLALGAALAVAVLLLYWPATGFEFSHHDDLQYYVQNGEVQNGLGWNGIVWAFTTGWASNWHPLTWLSLMMDADLSNGPTDAWMPHFTNILFHGLNSALLFWVLYRATQAKWRSLFVAALFAVHPLNVESVAWVAERKSVLSMFFFLLSLLPYIRFMEEGRSRWPEAGGRLEVKSGPPGVGSYKYFWYSVAAFALALMSKPMVVTLPFVLLLMDFWPLKRFTIYDRTSASQLRFTILRRVVVEKWAFFALSAAACVVAYLVQQHGHAVQTTEHFPLAGRIENVFVSYARYLARTFWPVHLAIYYPHPGQWPVVVWGLAAGLVIAISLMAIFCARRFPYLPMGWFWFLGTLVPMIGLVQAGTQSMADRYAYLPLIGIFIVIVWGGFELKERIKFLRAVYFTAGIIILAASAAVARHQLNFWQNDGTLFGHALAVTEDNPVAEVTFGTYLDRMQKSEEAMLHYRRALEIDPNDKTAHFDLANDLDDAGKTEEAIGEYRAALRSDPKFFMAGYNLGLVLERLGRRDEAIAQYKAVLQTEPSFAPAEQHLQELGITN